MWPGVSSLQGERTEELEAETGRHSPRPPSQLPQLGPLQGRLPAGPRLALVLRLRVWTRVSLPSFRMKTGAPGSVSVPPQPPASGEPAPQAGELLENTHGTC